MFQSIKFYVGLARVILRVLRKEAKIMLDPITKEILILDPIANETWVLA